ncbi:nuclear transport factor 2 family protein [Vibrio diazotrophicus]|uniref:nuclear transport factor 2 family protein n=1 Tax=Vibrio diazotrophicus TaxID=685 RepID=UPI0022AF8DD5|nr:nuclear transport factor 2 family protein [Vibrio diazotrophicus]MCZ4371026.1 nuclear transport factor 2 family protein [Vibrio diazotrophicus]
MDIQVIAQFYQQLNKDNLHLLPEVYHKHVVFEDAAHRIEGLEALQSYFANLYENVERCEFSIAEQHQSNDNGFITWTMHLQHPKLSGGNPIDVNGMSHLKFADGKVISHRDYFDLGEMLYEHIPLLGGIIRSIKRRLGQ